MVTSPARPFVNLRRCVKISWPKVPMKRQGDFQAALREDGAYQTAQQAACWGRIPFGPDVAMTTKTVLEVIRMRTFVALRRDTASSVGYCSTKLFRAFESI